MKSLIKRFTAVITAVIIFCFSVSPAFNVSAATASDFPVTDLYQVNYGNDLALNIIDQFYNNSSVVNLGYYPDNSYLSVSYNGYGKYYMFCCIKVSKCKYFNLSSRNDGNCIFVTSESLIYVQLNYDVDISTFYFSESSNNLYSGSSVLGIFYSISNGRYFTQSAYYSGGYGTINYSNSYNKFLFTYSKPINLDDYDLDYVVKNLGIDKDGFFKWLVSTGKISNLYDIFGNVADKKINTLIDYFDRYGSSSLSYITNLPTLLLDLKLNALPLDVIKSSYNVFKSLYKEYQAFKGLKATDVVKYMQGKMQLIDPEDDTLPSLDTDSFVVKDDDTVSDSTLKRILMMLYYILNSINYNTERVINSIDNLSFDSYTDLSPVVNAINNKVIDNSQDIDVDFSADADRIITAINNINIPSGGSSTDISLDVTITDDKQQEINDFFQDWNVKYTEKINDKIPVVGQLSSLFNDSFFEKCGIDVDGDGEVYQYYNTNRSMTLYDLPASVPVQDAGTTLAASSSAATSDEFMDSFVGQFDGADAHFLDDVYFTEDVPAFYVIICGKRTEIFDFKLFAKYRTQVHTIMIFCIFTVYFLSLYKSLPGIIGNVSDVVNAFRNNSEE